MTGSEMEDPVTIEYCVPCHFEKQAIQLADEIKDQFNDRVSQVILKPTQSIGHFEISFGEEVLFSKKNTGRLPHPGEIIQLLMMRLYK
ncbi:MAG: Rdx family protein [Anaerolineaceae bacterium]|nr:Rdx family protein [Anaerolineaceae bacterium]